LQTLVDLPIPYSRNFLFDFVVLGYRAWNSLPHDVKRLPTHGRFVSLICFIAFGSILYLIDFFFFFLFGFFWHIDALDVLGPFGPGWLVTRTVIWLRFCRIGMVLCEVAEDLTQNISNDIKSFFCF
jgi:hypothetical protein